MQNFLAKAVAVALLVGGFSFTGDLAWIAEKGQRIVGAVDVPMGFENTASVAPTLQPEAGAPATDPRTEQAVAAPPAPPEIQAGEPAPSQPFGGPEPMGAMFKPPLGGVSEISWASLDTGSRVIVWLAGPPYRCLVLDFVDPATGEALLYDVATVDTAGKPLATAGPPRRVVVGRDEIGRPRGEGIVRGGLIHVAQAGIATHAAGQWLGPIASLTLVN